LSYEKSGFSTIISPLVIVPVLLTQRTVVEFTVSIAERRFTTTFLFEILTAVMARLREMQSWNPQGTKIGFN